MSTAQRDGTGTVVIGLLADPGLPTKIMDRLHSILTDDFAQRIDAAVQWDLRMSKESLPLNAAGEIPLAEVGDRFRARNGWDMVVYLTDLPRLFGDQAVVCDVNTAHGTALISLPALGSLAVKRRVRDLIVKAVKELRNGTGRPEELIDPAHQFPRDLFPPLHASGHDADSFLALSGFRGQLQLLLGMVRSNRPWRLPLSLSSALAAAVASGAFGIFYASIWKMSAALSPLRLAIISFFAVLILAFWLISHNGLWDRSSDHPFRRKRFLYNTATALTVGIGTTLMYLILFLILFVAGVAVISPDYLQTELGHPVNAANYLNLTWLAASLGSVAGALGSTFDSVDDVRDATYSQRENERHKLAQQQDGKDRT